MAAATATDVVDRIHWWLTKTNTQVPEKIAAAYTQKGGWEGWAQVEIAFTVAEKYPTVTIDREVNVYEGTREKNDFVITENGQNDKQIVELKCERQSQTAAQFLAGFEKDCDKIHTGPIKAAYRPADGLAVGICVHKATFDHVMANCRFGITGAQIGSCWVVWYQEHVA